VPRSIDKSLENRPRKPLNMKRSNPGRENANKSATV